ncbi:MAG: hypothetical protein AB1649_24455, partial [Chloroflexota bacterium]
MNSGLYDERPRHRPITILAAGCLTLLFLGLCAGTGLFVRQKSVTRNEPTPTITPTIVSTPHVLVHQPEDDRRVRHEDFSVDSHEWILYYAAGKLEVMNDKLVLQSYTDNGMSVAARQSSITASGE